MHQDNEFDIKHQTIGSTSIEAIGSIASFFVAVFLVYKLYHARKELQENASSNMFLRSITMAIFAMFASIIFSISEFIIHIEVIFSNLNLFTDLFGCDPHTCEACTILDGICRLSSSLSYSLHLMIFCESILDNFYKAATVDSNLHHVKIMQLLIVIQFIVVNVFMLMFNQNKVFRIDQRMYSDIYVCFAVSNWILIIVYAIGGGINAMVCAALMWSFLSKSKKVTCHDHTISNINLSQH